MSLKEFANSRDYSCLCLYNKNFFMTGNKNEIHIFETYLGSKVQTIKLKNTNINIYNIKKIELPKIGECFAILSISFNKQKIIIMKK